MMRAFSKRRWGQALLLTCLVTLITSVNLPAAAADAAGPTDYRTDIVSVEPKSDAMTIEMIGGDSFISLRQLQPVEIVVLGYQGEPYVRFDADGVIYENLRSPARWLNEDRYGNEEPPAIASADALPQWDRVADGGHYVWHDHRSHWMNPARPPGATEGDQVLEATIPIQVADLPVTITVASFLLADPPWWPIAAGVVIGAALAWLISRRATGLNRWLVAGAVALWAAVFGFIAYRSVPAETEPSVLLWLLPVIALLAAAVALLSRSRLSTTVYLDGLTVVAGVAAAVWAWSARSGSLTKALIPSDAPASLDRLGISATLVVGVVLVGYGVFGPGPARTADGRRPCVASRC